MGVVERVAPIYLVAISIVTGDALGNFHVAIPLWLASTLALVALGAFLSSRRALGLIAAYVAIVFAANVAVANVLEPPRDVHSVATMVEGSRVTIEGRVYRETEHEAYGDRMYVKITRAAEQGSTMSESSGNVRIAVLGGGDFKLGDEIRLTARIHFPRNYGNPGEFDYAAFLRDQGITTTLTVLASDEVILVRRGWPTSLFGVLAVARGWGQRTLARDLAILISGGYSCTEVHLIDLFPQTFHMETIIRLRRGR